MADETIVYRNGDRSRTPVDIKDQEPGTELVLTTRHGRDIPFTVGVMKTNDMQKRVTIFSRYRDGSTEQ